MLILSRSFDKCSCRFGTDPLTPRNGKLSVPLCFVVDVNCTNFKLFSSANARKVVLMKTAPEVKFEFVKSPFLLQLKDTDEWQYWTKWFFPSKTHISCYMVKDCWVDGLPSFQFSFSSSTLFNCIINQTLNEVSGFNINKWWQQHAFARHTNGDIAYRQLLFYQFICFIHYKDTFDGCTTLT